MEALKILAWAIKEAMAYAMPTIIVLALSVSMNDIMNDVRDSQEQVLDIIRKSAAVQEDQYRRMGTIEREIAAARQRMYGLEIKLERVYEGNRKRNTGR